MVIREKQQIAICVLTAVIIGGFVLLGQIPLRIRKNAIVQIKNQQHQMTTKAVDQSQLMPTMRTRLQELQERVGNYDARLPSEQNLGVFLRELTGLMDAHDLSKQFIEPVKGVKTDKNQGLNAITVNMSCHAKLAQLFEFFKSLQSLDRLVRIEQVKLVNASDYDGQVKMKARVVIFYRTVAKS
ncbi:MAG: type 4a pilus biogenesis protein PilO [Planctomycetota bacterium]|jgi:Tfp pilus assembly protein PilO